jgi:hypothetical protein
MTLNETLTAIQYAKDLDIEYNVKLYLIVFFLIYSIVMLYLSFKWKQEYMWEQVIIWFLMRIPTSIILFFSPLYVIYFFRAISWEVLYVLLATIFSYAFVIIMLAGVLGMFSYFMKMFGLNEGFKKIELKKKW